MKKKNIPNGVYLDYAGATPLDPRVEKVISKYSKTIYGNASSIHSVGRQAKEIINNARKTVAGILNCRSEEIIFTGSGTESDNLAIWGVAQAYKNFGGHTRQNFRTSASGANSRSESENLGGHIITTKIEHPAVLKVCEYLGKNGFEITYLDVEKNGIVNPKILKQSLRPDTILVSVMYANNEIGTIQPIKKLVKTAHRLSTIDNRLKPIFHTDACQAAGALNLNVQELGVDLMTINGSKIYGPKGTGALFVRRGVRLIPQIVGGLQERGLRAGTENPALIAGFAEALKIADKIKNKESARLIKLRDYAISEILKNIPDSRLNGDAKLRLPNNINISFADVDGEMLMLALDQKGIQVSTGSACSTSSTEPSHVINALNLPSSYAKGNIRLTLGRQTTKKDIDYVLSILSQEVKRLRG